MAHSNKIVDRMNSSNRELAHLHYELSAISHRRDGFTVVELLAAMVVSSLVVWFGISMYLFAEKGMAHQQKRSEVKEAVSSCVYRVMADVESAAEVVRCDDTSLVVLHSLFRKINYHFDGSQIWRNGTPMNNPQITLKARAAFQEDTLSIQPKRSWHIQVLGCQGNIRDSAEVNLCTLITSQEFVNRFLNRDAK